MAWNCASTSVSSSDNRSHIPGTRDLRRRSETIRRTRQRNRQDSDAREWQTVGKLRRQAELLRTIILTVVLNHLCPTKPTAQTRRWLGLVR